MNLKLMEGKWYLIYLVDGNSIEGSVSKSKYGGNFLKITKDMDEDCDNDDIAISAIVCLRELEHENKAKKKKQTEEKKPVEKKKWQGL